MDTDRPDDVSPPRRNLSTGLRRSAGLQPSRGAVIAAVALIVITVGAAFVLNSSDDSAPEATAFPLDSWMPYWTLDEISDERANRMESMREISPFWYTATGVDSIVLDPNADPETTERFLDLARESGAAVVPSIVDHLPAGEMAALISDPRSRERHVDAIVDFAEQGEFDGIDIDYEQFAFSDGRGTWNATRPNWVSFVEDLGDALHAAGRTLTVSIPPIYDDQRSESSGFWVYDHGVIADHVDRIRIMAYDYSVNEPGPIAPLDFVARAIDGALAVGVDEEQLVLGIPIYGRNWPTGVSGDCPEGTELEETTSVNARTIDDLLDRRSATPEFDPITGESSFEYDIEFSDDATTCVQSRVVNYVDPTGARLRMEMARDRGLGGAALWAFGFDDDRVWRELDLVLDG
jgi:spore germination protein YaaH